MKGTLRGKPLLRALLSAAAVLVVVGGSALAFAMIDNTNSVHIRADEIEDSTLIIGSHLIYLGAMNDQIYEAAMESAQEASQFKRYYKSELAGGVWYDVTEAGALADITTAGTVVTDREIEDLYMTHHTKSDGITYDLRTGKSVCVFDIDNPYDLEGLSELEPIKMQYDVLAQTPEPSETNERDMQLIEEIYEKERKTEKTDELDAALYELQIYYEILIRDGADSAMSDMVMSVMEKIDAARRAEVLFSLQDSELENMNRAVGRDYTYLEGEITGGREAEEEADEAEPEESGGDADEGEDGEDGGEEETGRSKLESFTLNTDLLTAIGEAVSNVQESYIDATSNMLEEGMTVLSNVKYELSMRLVDSAAAENFAGCDEAVMQLIYLDRINNSTIREEDRERDFIETELLPRAENAYRASLSAGIGELYQMLPSTAAAATRANVLRQQKNETEIVRNELQFIIQAYTSRMAMETAMEHISQRIEDCDGFRDGIRSDAFEEYAQSSVDAHLDWLRQTLTSLQDSLGGRTMDHLMEQKENLQTERMTALDKNQLSVTKKLDAKIAAVDQEMEDLEDSLNAILQSDNTSESEKARAAAQLGERSASAALRAMRQNALDDLRHGNLEGVENIIDGIGALAATQPEGALGALKDIYQELSNQELTGAGANAGAVRDLASRVEEVTAEQMNNFANDFSKADIAQLIQGFLMENGGGAELPVEGLLDSLTLESIMQGLTDGQTAAVLAGLEMYAEQTGADAAKQVALNYSKTALENENMYVFQRLSAEPEIEFAPTDKIALICRYRYIFNDSQKAVTLQQGSQYYKFRAFDMIAEKGGTIEDMTRPAGFQGVIYIPWDAAEKYFGLEVMYLQGSSCGVLLTAEIKAEAVAFLDYLLEAGGEM